MAKRTFWAGTTSQTLDIFIQDSSSTVGAGLSGLTSGSSGLLCYYRKGATGSATQLTLTTQTVGGAWTSGGFVEIDATHQKGMYRLDIADTIVSSSPYATIYIYGATNMAPNISELEIVNYNPFDAVHLGLSCLPNTAVTSNASLLTSGTGTDQLHVASGIADANVKQWTSSNVLSPATAGIPDVNVKNMNNVAATSITTINANQGTTQPINFTGTAGSALVKSDTIDWASGAVPAPNVTGVPLVDVKYFLGTLSAGAAGYAAPDWGHINAPTTVVDLSGTTIKGLDTTGNAGVADAILGRNIAGGSSSGRTVSQALYPLRNKWTVNTTSGVYSVYFTDDATLSWTGSLSTDASAVPITGDAPST